MFRLVRLLVYMERCLLHWSLDAEGKWPGVFYVGASRVKTIDCLALHNPFNRSDAVSVGRGDAAVRSREAMDRIADAANEQVAQRDTVTPGIRALCPVSAL